MQLNGIEVADLGLEEKDFTTEKKLKFIQNCSAKFKEGKDIIHSMFTTLLVRSFFPFHCQNNPSDPAVDSYPSLVIDYPIASTLFVEVDGIFFLCTVVSPLPSHPSACRVCWSSRSPPPTQPFYQAT